MPNRNDRIDEVHRAIRALAASMPEIGLIHAVIEPVARRYCHWLVPQVLRALVLPHRSLLGLDLALEGAVSPPQRRLLDHLNAKNLGTPRWSAIAWNLSVGSCVACAHGAVHPGADHLEFWRVFGKIAPQSNIRALGTASSPVARSGTEVQPLLGVDITDLGWVGLVERYTSSPNAAASEGVVRRVLPEADKVDDVFHTSR
mmetsp:Transcript_58209/g.125855  ORF Transcript_58209/g.125855 Transcript_58209/m.125855 type:complete len:201 (+) Transcript_58209:309-911(+)